MKRLISICTLIGWTLLIAQGQLSVERSTLATGGGSLVNGSISTDITLAEAITQTVDSDSIVLTQGFQQGILNPNVSIDHAFDMAITYLVYPNPVGDRLNVQITSPVQTSLSLDILDLQGRSCNMQTHIRGQGVFSLHVEMGGLAPGLYVLHIVNKRRTIRRSIMIRKV
jgi:hypothetical protein